MHVTDSENVNQETNKRDEERVSPAQAIHRERDVSMEVADAQPRPEVVQQRLFRAQRAVRVEGEIESDDR